MGNQFCIFCPPGANNKKRGSLEDLPRQSFHNKILRKRKDIDWHDIYEKFELLGTGSMGTVTVVRKKSAKIGGSARKHNQKLSRGNRRINNSNLLQPSASNSLRSYDTSSSMNSYSGEEGSGSTSERGYATPTAAKVENPRNKFRNMYALKTINKELVGDPLFIEEMKNEVEILKELDHPNIVKPIETFESGREFCIIMELCTGGDLYSRDPYTEKAAAKIVGKLLSAIKYMHSNNIIHRDLKYENILFENSKPEAEIKVIDFGLSKKYEDAHADGSFSEGVGTIYTMAPEVLNGSYSEQADIWSIGVITFMLLSSNLPFYGKKRSHVIRKILKCDYKFKGHRWNNVSEEAKNFVKTLIVYDPKERSSCHNALNSDWQKSQFNLEHRRPDQDVMQNVQNSIKSYSSYGKFKKMALMLVAKKSNLEDIEVLRQAFDQYDSSNDGEISLEEFKAALSQYDYSDEDLEKMFEAVDIDNTGLIHYTEFIAATLEMFGLIEEERLAEAFDRLDDDDTGFISKENLVDIMGGQCSEEEIENMLREADILGDNQISYEEFLHIFVSDSSSNRDDGMNGSECVSTFADVQKNDLTTDNISGELVNV